jgi:hypothetical protein
VRYIYVDIGHLILILLLLFEPPQLLRSSCLIFISYLFYTTTMAMRGMPIARLIALCRYNLASGVLPNLPLIIHIAVGSAFSLVVLAVNADLMSITMSAKSDDTPAFNVFNLIVAILAMLTVPVMYGMDISNLPCILTLSHRIIIDLVRQGAFTSMIIVELAVLGTYT